MYKFKDADESVIGCVGPAICLLVGVSVGPMLMFRYLVGADFGGLGRFSVLFLVATQRLYMRVCPSVRPSVRPSVGWSVGP